MSSKNRSVLRERMNTVSRKHLYKVNGHWIVATTGTMALAVAGTLGLASTGHADTTAPVGAVPQTASVPETTAKATTPAATEVAPVVAQGNTTVNQAVQAAQPQISVAGGTLASTVPQTVSAGNIGNVQMNAQQQAAKIKAVGSADAGMNAAIQSGMSATQAMGGSDVPSSAINASSMTVDQIQSIGKSTTDQLSAVGAGNALQLSAAKDNGQVISHAGGVMAPGSQMDVSKLTPTEIASLTSRAAAVLSATGSADSQLVSASNQYTSNINAVGGQLKRSGEINTANDMTSDQIKESVLRQIVGISQTASADVAIKRVVGSALPAVNANSGLMSAGATIEASKLDPAVVTSMVAYQQAMVSTTASGDAAIAQARQQNQSAVNAAGGELTAGSHVNTANNMTPEQIGQLVASQVANLSATGQVDGSVAVALSQASQAAKSFGVDLLSGSNIDVSSMTGDQIRQLGESLVGNLSLVAGHDIMLGSAVPAVSDEVSAAGGKMTPGRVIDATDWSPAQIQSEEAEQSAMIAATGSADTDVKSHADAEAKDINAVGGTIKQSGTINTANNMTPVKIASHVKAQDQRISQTASADRGIAQAVKDNASVISGAKGVEKPGSVIDTTDLTPAQVDSLVKNQEAMVSATGSADADVKSHADAAARDIDAAGGTIKQSGTVNTADNVTVSEVASHVKAQDQQISQTASADRGVLSAAKSASGKIAKADGVEKFGSAIDTTNLTSQQIDSLAANQEAMLSATASADAEVKSDADSAASDITKFGGTIKQSGTVNTADNMTPEKVASDVAKQSTQISATASADRAIEKVVNASSSAISAISGITKHGSTINTIDLTSDQVSSLLANQETMVSATASADMVLKSMVDSVASAVKSNGGFVTASGSVNTANDMTADQINSAVDIQLGRLSAVNQVDQSLADLLKNGSATIFGGNIKAVSAVDASTKTADQVKSMGQSQAALISQVISNNVMLSNVEASASSIAARVGGKIQKGMPINVTGKSVSEIASLASAQAAVLSAVADVDNSLGSALVNSEAITKAGGTLTRGSDINVASMTPDEIKAAGQKQVANVSATVFGDDVIQNAVAKVWSQTVTKGSAVNVSSMTPAQIASLTASEADAIGQTQNANEQLSQAVKQTSEAIHRIGGTTVSVAAKDTTKLTSDQIGSSTASQTGKLAETATADDLVSSAVSEHAGVVMSSVAAVNATSMGSQQIVSEVHSQADHISYTDSMQSTVSTEVAAQLSKVTTAGGTITKSGVFDTTTLTKDEMTSWTGSEQGHLQHVGSNDQLLTDTLKSQHSGLTVLNGSAVSEAAIDVTNKTNAEIDLLMQSQATLISQASSANEQMNSMYTSASDEDVVMSVAQASLSNKQAIDGLLTSTTAALVSAVTVAKESKAVTAAVQSFNVAMDAIVDQYKQAGGNPLDVQTVAINIGDDASTVAQKAQTSLAALSAQDSQVESQMAVATSTMNYIKQNVDGMITNLGTEVETTPGLTYTSGVNVQVHSIGDIESDWENQETSVRAIITNRQKYNSVVDSFDPSKQSGTGHTALTTAIKTAEAVGVKVSSTTPENKGEVDPLDSSAVSAMATAIDNDYAYQASAVSDAIALQEQYNSQVAQQESLDDAAKASMQAIEQAATATPSRYAENVQAWGLKDQAMYWNDFAGDGNHPGRANNDADDFGFSFDVDISNLKANQIVDILKLHETSTEDPDFKTMMRSPIGLYGQPLMVNGVQYGTIYAKFTSDNNLANGGYEPSDIDVYLKLDKDVPGIGKQSFSFDHLGFMPTNYLALPSWFKQRDETHLILSVLQASDGKTVASKTIDIIKPTNSELTDNLAPSLENHSNPYDFWCRAQLRDLIGLRSQGDFDKFVSSLGQQNTVDNRSYYFVNQKVTNSTGFASLNGNTTFTNWSSIQPEVLAFDSNGKPIFPKDWNSTQDKPDGAAGGTGQDSRATQAPDGLNVQQLQSYALKHLNDMKPAQAEGWTWFSKQDGNTFIEVSYFTKEALQQALARKMSDTNLYLSSSWDLQSDPNPQQALKNTLTSLNGVNDGMPYWQSIAGTYFKYGDPTVPNTTTTYILDDNGNVRAQSQSVSEPPVEIHAGQSGVRVHYIDGSTGYEMRDINYNVGDPGSTITVDPQLIPGYELSSVGAKDVPSYAQIVESPQEVDYPSAGTWHDVYIVYQKFVPSGGVSVSYHTNITNVEAVQAELSLHGYYDNDRFAPVKTTNDTPKPNMTVMSADPIYMALSTSVPDVKTNYHAYDTNLIDHFNYQDAPLSTQYHGYDDHGGYAPEDLNYIPLGTTYQRYDTDGTKIPPMIPDPKNPGHEIPNPKFTGYTPWSTTWQNYSTDGTNIPPMIPDPKNPGHKIPNPKFTGYTPWSTTWQSYSSDGEAIGKDVPPVIPDPNNPGHYIKNPKFTGYAPMTAQKRTLSTKYTILDSDGSKIPPVVSDGHGGYQPNPKFTGYAPFSYTYSPYSDDGTKVPSMIPDGHGGYQPNPKFTGYAPLSMTYSPLSTKYHNYVAAPEKAPKKPAQLVQSVQQVVPAPQVVSMPAASVPLASLAPSAPAEPAQPVQSVQQVAPASQAVSMPATSVPLVSLAPSAPAAQKAVLPQTSHEDQGYLALIGLTGLALASTLSLLGVQKKRLTD